MPVSNSPTSLTDHHAPAVAALDDSRRHRHATSHSARTEVARSIPQNQMSVESRYWWQTPLIMLSDQLSSFPLIFDTNAKKDKWNRAVRRRGNDHACLLKSYASAVFATVAHLVPLCSEHFNPHDKANKHKNSEYAKIQLTHPSKACLPPFHKEWRNFFKTHLSFPY